MHALPTTIAKVRKRNARVRNGYFEHKSDVRADDAPAIDIEGADRLRSRLRDAALLGAARGGIPYVQRAQKSVTNKPPSTQLATRGAEWRTCSVGDPDLVATQVVLAAVGTIVYRDTFNPRTRGHLH